MTYPSNATIRREYVKSTNDGKLRGPYLYAYWKDKGKLKKKYIGKNWDEWVNRMTAKTAGFTHATYRKVEFIRKYEENNPKNPLQFSIDKLKRGGISTDWAYRVVKEQEEGIRYFRLCRLAEREGLTLNEDNDSEYIKTILKRQNLDSIEALDSYLNSVFR